MFLPNDTSTNNRRLKWHFNLFLRGRVVAGCLNAVALITAVSPPEIRLIATTIGRASSISTSFVRRFFLFLPIRAQTTNPEKTFPEFRGHQIVEDRINGRVQIEHHSTEIEQGEVALDTKVEDYFNWNDQDPKCQCPKW